MLTPLSHIKLKRCVLTSAQADQGVYAYGNSVPPLRTGAEGTVDARMTSEKMATIAEQDGVIEKVSEKGITILYKDGTKESHPLGLTYGEAAGVIHPHPMATLWKEGDKVKAGQNLTYHKHYFDPDRANPGYVLFKQNMTITVALLDSIHELEDGSRITEETARKLTTCISEIHDVPLMFNQRLSNLKDVGDHVDIDTVLGVVSDPETPYEGDLDEESLNTLRLIGGKVFSAETTGEITRVEVYYRGEYEELSDNLKKVVDKIERRNKAEAKESGQAFYPGKVDTSFRREGQPLDPQQIVVRFFITHDVGVQRGDKNTFSLQLKSILSQIMTGRNETVGGIKLGGIFGGTSVLDRMVNSAYHNGMASMLLRVESKNIAKLYRGHAKPVYAKP